MRWLLLVIAVVGCKSSAGPATSIANTDRSCGKDTDCTLAIDTCCTGCGDIIGEPVNAKAWLKDSAARDKACTGRDCPQYKCDKLPACREEGHAVCKLGRCALAMVPNDTCAQLATTPALYCETADDCAMQTLHDDCCDHCGGTPMNKTAAVQARVAIEKQCASKPQNCPAIDCPAQMPACVAHKCVVPQ